MNKCPKCGTKGEVAFCPECGTKMEEIAVIKKCPNCGTIGDSVFCPNCGGKMIDEEVPEGAVDEQIQAGETIPQEELISSDNGTGEVQASNTRAIPPIDADSVVEPSEEAINTETAAEPFTTGDNPIVKSESEIEIIPPGMGGTQYDEVLSIKEKPPKKKKTGLIIGIIAAVVVIGGIAAFMFGSGGGVIGKDIKEGVDGKTIHNLTYQIPTSWKQDETYENDNAFYETQKYEKQGEEETSNISCYVNYCGESRYYGNSLDDYSGLMSGYGEATQNEVTVEGATGKVVSVTSTDADNEYGYVDTYIFEADGSIFTIAFYTQENSHDTAGMNELINMIDFASYKTDVNEITAEKGKFNVSCDALMREIISTANKDNEVEGYECGPFSYEESSTKGGALCYGVLEDGSQTGITISFYKDKDRDKSVKAYEDIPKSMAVANSLSSVISYNNAEYLLVNAAVFQTVGDVNFDQGSSDYTNKVNDAKGYESTGFYTNEMELNGFNFDIGASTKDEPAVYINIY